MRKYVASNMLYLDRLFNESTNDRKSRKHTLYHCKNSPKNRITTNTNIKSRMETANVSKRQTDKEQETVVGLLYFAFYIKPSLNKEFGYR